MWKGIRSVFPAVTLHGCTFHWSQAVFRKVQALGLSGSYRRGGKTARLIRRIFALPFLPAEHVRPAFAKLQGKVGGDPALSDLFAYIHTTWINSTDWSVEELSHCTAEFD